MPTRIWKKPTESASPPSRLRRPDSTRPAITGSSAGMPRRCASLAHPGGDLRLRGIVARIGRRRRRRGRLPPAVAGLARCCRRRRRRSSSSSSLPSPSSSRRCRRPPRPSFVLVAPRPRPRRPPPRRSGRRRSSRCRRRRLAVALRVGLGVRVPARVLERLPARRARPRRRRRPPRRSSATRPPLDRGARQPPAAPRTSSGGFQPGRSDRRSRCGCGSGGRRR